VAEEWIGAEFHGLDAVMVFFTERKLDALARKGDFVKSEGFELGGIPLKV
jgi:hypothetical protein